MDKEQVLKMVKELLEIEEKNNIFNLTSRERKEFQNIVESMFEEKESTELSINTPKGILRASTIEDRDGSGLHIELQPKGLNNSIDVAKARYHKYNDTIDIYTWNDTYDDYYTTHRSIENLDEFIENEREYSSRE